MLIAKIRRRISVAIGFSVVSALLLPVPQSMAQSMSGMHMQPRKAAQPCKSSQPLGCADRASGAFSPDGTLLLAWTQDKKVYFARSKDKGQSWTLPLMIGDAREGFDGGGDARPQLAANAKGSVLIAYDTFKDQNWNAEIWLASSVDGGTHFDTPRVFEPESVSQRLPVLSMTPAGRILMLWQDKRLSGPQKRPGASLAYAWSMDGGRTFSPSAIAAEVSCECCRIGVTNSSSGEPVAAFRTIFPEQVRDHALLQFSPSGSPRAPLRVATDNWKTNACPHHGPSVSVSNDGTTHMVWYTQGQARQGLFYARLGHGEQAFSEPQRLGGVDDASSHPYVLVQGQQVWRVWKAFDGQASHVMLQQSGNDGRDWSAPKVISSSTGGSDHPLLLGYQDHAYLSWLSSQHGYQLIDLKE
ncbi:sialidase family protein [Castellaniella sp. MT123]|uniref:sialidase family protein n=1 Tax=Castellaniella sp. MT123 TaxID=3140381 RepID=UPI0031F4739C